MPEDFYPAAASSTFIAVLRRREAEACHLITRWLANRFNTSPSGLCAHCGDGERVGDPAWLAAREAEARRALRIDHDDSRRMAGRRAEPEALARRTIGLHPHLALFSLEEA
jgi:hypothetical protein